MWPVVSFSKDVTLQIDLATAAIALIALVFSIWSFRNQRRISIESLRIQRDNDIIGWTNAVIETIVGIEFLLRDPRRQGLQTQFFHTRDDYLAELSAAIDKGRLYFPNFVLDVIEPGTAQPPPEHKATLLDRLVEIYDMIKDIDPQTPTALDATKRRLLLRKRAFMEQARTEVDPQRRVQFLTE